MFKWIRKQTYKIKCTKTVLSLINNDKLYEAYAYVKEHVSEDEVNFVYNSAVKTINDWKYIKSSFNAKKVGVK